MGYAYAVSRMLETETMNADKGFRKAPAKFIQPTGAAAVRNVTAERR
jgi:hypothetical protein